MITWTQNESITLLEVNFGNEIIKFRLSNDLIPYLVNNTPRVFYVYVFYKNQNISELVNFEGLKPYVRQTSKLTIKVPASADGTFNQVSTSGSDGFFIIKRGDVYEDKFLGPNGWQIQEYRHSFILWEKQQNENFFTSPLQQTTQSLKTPTQNFICPSCGEELEMKYSYCPVCFKIFSDPVADVDFLL